MLWLFASVSGLRRPKPESDFKDDGLGLGGFWDLKVKLVQEVTSRKEGREILLFISQRFMRIYSVLALQLQR